MTGYTLPTDRALFLAEWAHVRILVDRQYCQLGHVAADEVGGWWLDADRHLVATFRLFRGPSRWYSALGLVVWRRGEGPVWGLGGLVFSWDDLENRLDDITRLC